MFVKICGVRTLEELRIVEKYADATGVVVECESKRRIPLDVAGRIIENSEIPVFVVSTLDKFEDWANLIEKLDADYVQIHAEVEPEIVDGVREMGVSVMKAFEVPKVCSDPKHEAEKLIERIEEFRADYILLDTGKGSGKIHNHRISKIVAERFEIILAGGLNPENVSEIVEFVKPVGVDVSSGVESGRGKDEKKIRDFVRALGRW